MALHLECRRPAPLYKTFLMYLGLININIGSVNSTWPCDQLQDQMFTTESYLTYAISSTSPNQSAPPWPGTAGTACHHGPHLPPHA